MVSEENSKPMITLAVVDDHTLLRKGLVRCLLSQANDCVVVLEADDGRMLIEGLQALGHDALPDIVLLDIHMPCMDGFETLRWLKQHHPGIHVIMLTMYADPPTVIRCLRLGANAFLPKDVEVEEVVHTIRMVKEKGEYYSPFVGGLAVAALKQNAPKYPQLKDLVLTEKELEFLKLACSELSYKDIADKMFISTRTVDIYRDRLFEKLNVRSRVGLALFAIRNKLVRPLEQNYAQPSISRSL